MNIMVTGVSGGYGKYALSYLKRFAKNENIIALVRNEEKAKELIEQNVEVRIGDYSDYDSMVKALHGIDRLLFVSVSIPNIQKSVVDAAKVNGVKYITYTSLCGLEHEKFGLEQNHRQTEQWIRESGIPHTFLRNNWYLEIAAPLIYAGIQSGKYYYFSGNSKLAFALKREYAEAGARVILDSNAPEILELSGNPVSYKELAEATKQPMEIISVSQTEFTQKMDSATISEMGLMLSTVYQAYALKGNNGESELSSETLEQILGHPLTPLSEAINEVVNDRNML